MPKIRSIAPVREQASILQTLEHALAGGADLLGQKPYQRLKDEVRNVQYGWKQAETVASIALCISGRYERLGMRLLH